MEDNSTNNKLDGKIKDVLRNYEADYDINDWAKIDAKLGRSQTSSFSVNSKYLTRGAIALLVIAAIFSVYKFVPFDIFKSKQSTKQETPVQKPEEKPNNTITENPVVVANNVDSITISDTTETNITEPAIAANNISEEKDIATKESIEKTKETVADNNRTKEKKSEKSKEKSGTKETLTVDDKTQVIIMGNEPVFGDMIDSAKGITSKTKENEQTKKSAKEKGMVPVGWKSFIVNQDSLKKTQTKKDSIK